MIKGISSISGSCSKFYIQFIPNIHKYIIMFIKIPSSTALRLRYGIDATMVMIPILDFDTILNCVFNSVELVAQEKLSWREREKNKWKKTRNDEYQHEFNQQKGIARGTGIVGKMCQQSKYYCRILIDIDFCSIIKF